MDESFPEVLLPLITAYHLGEKVVLLFEYDGTLTPLVNHPWEAKLAPRTREQLSHLAKLPHVYLGVLSARKIEDLEQMVALPGLFYCGVSGNELKLSGQCIVHPTALQNAPLIDELACRLTAIERVYPGAWVENRRYGFTVHYRGVDSTLHEEVYARVLRFLDRWADKLSIRDAPLAIEVTVARAGTKGDAVRKMVAHVGEPLFVLYAGDSANDAFAAATALGGIALCVGSSAPPSASAHLPDPLALSDWLDILLAQLHQEAVPT